MSVDRDPELHRGWPQHSHYETSAFTSTDPLLLCGCWGPFQQLVIHSVLESLKLGEVRVGKAGPREGPG